MAKKKVVRKETIKKKVKQVQVTVKIPVPKFSEEELLVEEILADSRLPKYSEFLTGGRDILRYHSEIERDYGKEMTRFGIGMTSLMKQKDEMARKG